MAGTDVVHAFDVLRKAFHIFTRDQCMLIGMLCWSLWTCRNKRVWERANRLDFGVQATAMHLLNDWRKA